MKHPVSVRRLLIGEGIPKICVPVMGKDEREVLRSAGEALACLPDLLEWRADFLQRAGELPAVLEVLRQLRARIGETPLLFTFRTGAEGGEQEIAPEKYQALYTGVLQSRLTDAADIELRQEEKLVRALLSEASACGVRVILSSHDFQKTPPEDELLARFQRMQALGADIAKIAVMPVCAADVLTLLSATEKAARTLDIPVISMSMGGEGMVSRLLGECFGSAVTFGMAAQASAPGQIPAGELREMLEKIHWYR